MARFFATTAMGGTLYVEGIALGGPWDTGRLVLQDEAIVDRVLLPGTADRKVWTSQELEAAVGESASRPSASRVWVHEALVEVAHAIWERQRG